MANEIYTIICIIGFQIEKSYVVKILKTCYHRGMNEHKFDGKAKLYAAYRPSYASGLIDDLVEDLPKGAKVADIGSGTGKLTELLLARGMNVFAVEPNDDMRAAAEEAFGGNALFCSVPASAESTTLPDGKMELVTAAQAFHWFDRDAFRKECRRILTATRSARNAAAF